MQTKRMFSKHPEVHGDTDEALVAAIEEALACAQACTACADACLAEQGVSHLRQCIRVNLDCADVCSVTASVVTRRTGVECAVIRTVLDACAKVCGLCAQECRRHADMHEHCAVCAEACDASQQACQAALRALGPVSTPGAPA